MAHPGPSRTIIVEPVTAPARRPAPAREAPPVRTAPAPPVPPGPARREPAPA